METYHKIQTIYKRDPANSFKTLLEGEYSLPEFEYLKDNTWVFTEKVDGCLHPGQKIQTDQGAIPVGKIVNNKLPVRVLSYNEELQICEYKEIVHYHKEERLRPFVCVKIKSRNKGNRDKAIICTDNHKFLTTNGWYRADELAAGDTVFHLEKRLPEMLGQVLLGTALGDSHIRHTGEASRVVELSHCEAQREYLEYKASLFGSIFVSSKSSKGGYAGSTTQYRGYLRPTPSISDFIIKHCEVDGKREITEAWVNALTPLSLAFWYMDDGNCHFTTKQRPNIRLATNRFSEAEVKLLTGALMDKFNLESSVHFSKGWYIQLSADATATFFSLIFPFICECMKYKMPVAYRKIPCVLEGQTYPFPSGTLETNVVSVEKNSLSSKPDGRYQYDLTVADNSNYFTSSVLVHNTNIRVMYDGKEITYGGKTDRANIPAKLVNALREMFDDKLMAFEHLFPADAEKGELPQVCIYGEGYGPGIQKVGANYRGDQSFVLFDVRVNGWWLKREDVVGVADALSLTAVPIVGLGSLYDMVAKCKEGFQSEWGDFRAEGIVARPWVDLQTRAGRRIITKLKCKDFDHKGKQ